LQAAFPGTKAKTKPNDLDEGNEAHTQNEAEETSDHGHEISPGEDHNEYKKLFHFIKLN